MAPLGRVVTLPPSYPDATPKHLFFINIIDRHMAVNEDGIPIGVSTVKPGLVTEVLLVRPSEHTNVETIDALDAREDTSGDFFSWSGRSCWWHEETRGWMNARSDESL